LTRYTLSRGGASWQAEKGLAAPSPGRFTQAGRRLMAPAGRDPG